MKRFLGFVAIAGVVLLGGAARSAYATETVVSEGKAIALDRKKGNCLSCHVIEDEPLPGNAGPPLFMMRTRYPDKAKLRAQIWDPTALNSQTIMPPFGRHRILTEEEIDKVTEYIHSL
jgi:sulfur-oxidizing protein SoxX